MFCLVIDFYLGSLVLVIYSWFTFDFRADVVSFVFLLLETRIVVCMMFVIIG